LKVINIGIGKTIAYAFNAFLSLAIYKNKNSTNFPVNYRISLMFYILGVIFCWIFWYMASCENRKRAAVAVETADMAWEGSFKS
jgi:hypothetical protein